VISRSSAMQYKGSRPPTRRIGEELGVSHLLEGTVRWERAAGGPSRVRVTPQLVRVADDTSLWSERYDHALDQIFTVQSLIAEEVIGSLGVVLLEPERSALAARPTENLEAYQAYLRGLEHWNRAGFDYERFELAGDLFQRASELDPEFLQPVATNVMVYGLLYFAFGEDEHLRLTEEARRRVHAIGHGEAEVHIAEGTYLYYVERDWQGAFEEYEAAAEMQPGSAEPLELMAYIRRRQGRLEEAVGLLERSLRLDPQNAHKTFQVGDTLRGLRRFAEADEWLQRAIVLEPDNSQLYEAAAENRVAWKGAEGFAEARELLRRAPDQQQERVAKALAAIDIWEGEPRRALDRLTAVEDSAAWPLRAWAIEQTGDRAGLAALLESCIEELGALPEVREGLFGSFFQRAARGWCLAAAGRADEALAVVEELERQAEIAGDDRFGSPQSMEALAAVEARAGRVERAVERLERLLRAEYQLAITVGRLRSEGQWEPLRGDPQP